MNAKDKSINKSFSNWKQMEVEKHFNVSLQLKSPILEEWLQTTETINDFEREVLKKLVEKAFIYVNTWNETELTNKLISILFYLVDFDNITYSLFLERPINGEINGITINGNVDMMIAKGRGEPEHPYFFLQEFKREKTNSGDPIAQMLLAMLLAQQENKMEMPVYGSYVNGRMWVFAVLEGNTYTLSNSYTMTHQDDLEQIMRILKSLKKKIEQQLGLNSSN